MPGRHFVCGDIHGCVTILHTRLHALGFDYENDHLHALGDLVDRGPENIEAVRLLRAPWFDSIMGNHEILMLEGGVGHLVNGGEWFFTQSYAVQRELRDAVKNLPYTRTVTTPTGRRIGLVHADVFGNDWDRFVQLTNDGDGRARTHATWARERVYMTNPPPVRGVDAVYFGHTPRKTPQRHGQFNWIDTGCFATGVLTVEELV